MPRLTICSHDLHWHWIDWTLLCDTMEVSMLHLAWLTTAQYVFQPAFAGRLESVSQKIVSCGPRTKAIAVDRFHEKLSPANWVQGVTAISLKISRQKWGPTCDLDMSNLVRWWPSPKLYIYLWWWPPPSQFFFILCKCHHQGCLHIGHI